MLKFARAALLPFLLANPANAAAPANSAESTTVKVALLDMTAVFGPSEAPAILVMAPG